MSIALLLGALFLIGLAADLIGRKTFLPRVTLLLVAGLAVGPSGFALLPEAFIAQWFEPMTSIALALVGFLLGHQLSVSALREHGVEVIAITLCKVFGTWAVVGILLILAGANPVVALLLAGIAPASAPAATLDIVHESNIRNEFTETLLSIVALDDVLGLLVFIVTVGFASAVYGDGGAAGAVQQGLIEIGGCIVLGVALGVPMAYVTGRVQPGEPTLAEALGFVLLSAGLAELLGLLPILPAMVMGMTVASVARHHERPFDAIEGVEWPFMIMFFVLAGASLDVDALKVAGAITVFYIVARAIGIYVGARAGCSFVRTSPGLRRWLGLALLPQAGVAIGMALLAAQRFPEIAPVVLAVVVASTVVLETIGSVLTRLAIRRGA